jgi:hypothetical protein
MTQAEKNAQEPRWRVVLNWSAVLAFFSIPLILFILQLLGDILPWHIREHIPELKYLVSFYQSVTGLVFGLAGLNSMDKFIALKNGARSGPGQGTDKEMKANG